MEKEQDLNPEQITAVTHLSGPLLVLAGAGSGKTRVVTYRIVHLIRQAGVPPSQILAVTFTNKAAGEMQERIYALTSKTPPSEKRNWAFLTRGFEQEYPLISTFHSLGARILREFIHHLGYPQNFVIYDEEDSNKLLKTCLAPEHKEESAHVKAFRGLISHAKNQLLDPSAVEVDDLPASIQKEFPRAYYLYQEGLKNAHAVDFDDLLFLTVRLLKEHPEVLSTLQERWHYLLIDEYQDTNQAQYLIARMLIEKTHNIFVVGDPDQSIYSWRGANIRNILDFEKDYPGAKIIRLEQNYRSRKNILDAANHLVKHNQNRYEKALWSDRGEGEKISLFVADSEREEASFVIHEMERLHLTHKIPYKQMAIFYRTNFQSRLFEDVLLKMRIPYVIVGGISFYHRREIKDLLAFLHMVESSSDIVAFMRTINLPKRGLGATTIEKLRVQSALSNQPILACALNPPEEMRLSTKQKESLKQYAQLIHELRAVKEEGSLSKLMTETIRRSGYLDFLREDRETFQDRKGNIEELVAKASEWERFNPESSLQEFLEELCLKSAVDEIPSDDTVHLMTIHNGKGLEFTAVFLVGMEEDLFPHANSRESHERLEEERRLCYVGMTRAKERLYLTAAEARFIWGISRRMRPSRFLREIPKEYIHRVQ